MLGIVIVAIGTALMYNATSTGQMIAHFSVFGLAFATLLPLRALAMSDRFAGPEYGSIMGAQWMLIMFAGAAGPGLVGLLKQTTGSYQAPVMIMTVMLVGSFALLRRSDLKRARASRKLTSPAVSRRPTVLQDRRGRRRNRPISGPDRVRPAHHVD